MMLREKDRLALEKIFAGAGVPLEVWAYGSRVNGGAHEGSDLDLVGRTPDLSPMPLGCYCAIKDQIQDSTIPILVEFRDWARIPESFQKNILRKHEVLYGG
jgi:predicted nucleotidyltransferase